jgi:protein-L-isoaspartate(D-aspartate) O-methyltransferase
MDMQVRTRFVLNLFIITSLFLFPLIVRADSEEALFAKKRKQMVENQIKARGIKNQRVLDAMVKVKRHLFVPSNIRYLAYEDYPLPIGEGQTISQPYIVALMTELLELRGTERVLEIGTGSGYQAAILAELAKEVYTIEIMEPLARRSEGLLKELNYHNIKAKVGDGFLGWQQFAPFDGIIVTCAPEKIPPPLYEQLAKSGRLVIPVGTYWQNLKIVRKIKGRITEEDVAPVRFVPMLRGK